MISVTQRLNQTRKRSIKTLHMPWHALFEEQAARTEKHSTDLIDALKQCTKTRDFECGKMLHQHVDDHNLQSDILVTNTLVEMYRRCSSVDCARQVFEESGCKNVVTWSTLIMAYVENGQSELALELFYKMDCKPTHVTFTAAAKAIACMASGKRWNKDMLLEKGVAIHESIKQHSYQFMSVSSTLVDMYRKCGDIQSARKVFESMPEKDVVTWTCLMLGYVDNGQYVHALELLNCMDCKPNYVTYVAALKACAAMACGKDLKRQTALEKGRAIHREVKQLGYESNAFVASTLVDMYSKCGEMQEALYTFETMTSRSVVSWNCLILGYVENGQPLAALKVFDQMDCEPNPVTYIAALKACAAQACEGDAQRVLMLTRGKAIHEKLSCQCESPVVSNALIDMYTKCGDIKRAREVFESMSKDVVSWTSLISGYVENREYTEALELFTRMDCEANHVTYVCALKACGCLVAASRGRLIHATVCKLGLEEEEVVSNTLVDFYGRCGLMSTAEEIFHCMHSPDIVSWTALLAGFSSLGDSAEVFRLARGIHDAGLRLNSVTFVCILSACSHAGMVKEAQLYFHSMQKYGVNPTLEHLTCMVDMLGRANRCEEAVAAINTMPFQPDRVTWMTLLGSCKKWSNLEAGKVAFDALVSGGDEEYWPAAYVLMRDIYGSLGMWENHEKLERKRKELEAG